MTGEQEIKFRSRIDVELIRAFADDVWVEQAARISTRSEMKDRPTGGLINRLMKDRHGTPFEHGGTFTFRVHAPIFVFREWMRHRVGWSYNEQSGRYTEFEPVFYVPGDDRPLVQTGKAMDYDLHPGDAEQREHVVNASRHACFVAWDMYQVMLDAGCAREVARNVLPVATYSSMYATCNPRSLMHFLSLRTRDETAAYPSKPQFEIDDAARQMEIHFAETMPLTHEAFTRNGRVAP